MMKLLNQLVARGIRLSATPEGELKIYAGNIGLTDPEKIAIKAEKSELLNFLEGGYAACQSYSQERLWFLDRLGFGAQYHVPGLARIEGDLDISVLRQALKFLFDRHVSLRTNFTSIDSVAVQKVHPVKEVAIELRDISTLGYEQQEQLQKQMVQEFIERPFNLENDLLCKVMLLVLAPQRHILALCLHHIITDGWSMRVLLGDLTEAYSAFLDEYPPQLKPLALDYAAYAAWERETLTETKLAHELAYWKTQLTGYQNLEMPLDFARPAQSSGQGGYYQFELSQAQGRLIKQVSRERKTTAFTLFMAAVYLLLRKYSGQTDICLGMPVANRHQRDIEDIIGFFVNTLVMRINPEDKNELSVNDLLQHVHQVIVDGQDNQHVPIEKILDALQPERDLSRSPIFQVLINYTPLRLGKVPFGNCMLEPLFDFEIKEAKFNLTFTYNEFEDEHANIGIEYASELFAIDTIQRMAGYLRKILDFLMVSPNRSIKSIDLLETDERNTLLKTGCGPETANPNLCLHDLFIKQAERTPAHPAVIFEEQSLSYWQLHQDSDQLARYLQTQGVQLDSIVAVCLQRSPAMLIALLGILKAGGAYLPMDANTPSERISTLLHDSQTRFLITQESLIHRLSEATQNLDGKLLAIDSDWSAIAQAQAELRHDVKPEHLAYVIYTSGSTGQPKGVMVEHRNVVNHNLAVIDAYQLTPQDRVLQFSTISFDIFVEEVFPTLLSGGTVILMDGSRYTDLDYFKATLKNQRVSLVNLPTAFWHTLADENFSDTALSRVIIGGEKAESQKYQHWHSNNPGIPVINTYGPTETTVISLLYPIPPELDPTRPIPLGSPLANTQIYLLDPDLNPVPMGVPGELHIAGKGVARGYLNQPALTAEKFIANPFGDGKLYKTGDVVKWSNDGRLEYVGRSDDQVKIRGFRVELGEVEQALSKFPGIQNPVVITKSLRGAKQLVAFFTTNGMTADQVQLKSFLRELLPEYMLPIGFIALEKLPLTSGGKIDRQALQKLPVDFAGTGEFKPPQTPLGQQIAAIWEEVLAVKQVGLQDNFFELGGHSLLTVQLVSRINISLNDTQLMVADIFKYPTLQALVDYLEKPMTTITKSPYRVDLRPGIPTFIVPGMPGLCEGYFELAECLTREGPVFGLQMKGYAGDAPATTITEMAAHNIAQIKGIITKGRINLYAHSYGGTVVYEMLQQLHADEFDIGEIVFIDSGILTKQGTIDKASVTAFCNFILSNANINPEPLAEKITEILKHQPYDSWKKHLADLMAATIPNFSAEYFLNIWQVIETSIKATYEYGSKLPFNITLVIAEGSKGWLASNSWDAYFEQVKVISAKGDHLSIVKLPDCAAWLQALSPSQKVNVKTGVIQQMHTEDPGSILSVRQLEKKYGKIKAVDGVSLEIKSGVCFGLLGPNGAGKTSTLEMMEGILKPSSGEIYFRGAPINRKYTEHIGIQFQHTALQDLLTVREVLQMFQKLYPNSLALEDIIEACSLQEYIDRDTKKLSGGQRQRLLLGIALINNPDILFLDEPTTGLDPQARHNFWNLIRAIKALGKTIILTTHYMEEAEQLCDEVAIIDKGRILVQDAPAKLLQQHFDGVLIRLPKASGLAEQTGLSFDVYTAQESVEFITNNVEAAIVQLSRIGIPLQGLTISAPSLENLFLKLTGHSLRS